MAQRRRQGQAAGQSRAQWESAKTEPRPQLDLPTAVTALVGVAAAIAAIVIATDGLQQQRSDAHYSALWIVPRDHASDTIEIGVLNHQGSVHEYRLEIEATGQDQEIGHWQGRLGARGRKQVLLPPGAVPPGTQLVVSLYRDGSLYRRAELQAGIEA